MGEKKVEQNHATYYKDYQKPKGGDGPRWATYVGMSPEEESLKLTSMTFYGKYGKGEMREEAEGAINHSHEVCL